MKNAWAIFFVFGSCCGSALSTALTQTRPRASVATIAAYPEYKGSIMAMGTIVVQDTEAGIKVMGTLTGLEDGATGGIHIHTGVTCDDASLVGGHYFGGDSVDPWLTTSYTTNSMGVASVELSLDGFTLGGNYPVAGRALVVHAADGARIGCGVLMSTAGEVVTLGKYPGYTGTYEDTVTGTVIVTNVDEQDFTGDGVSIKGTIAGLEMGKTGGFHIHSGYSCDDAAAVGGHYFDASAVDPWLNTQYTTNSKGCATVDISVSDFTLDQSWPVAYRAVVAHLSSNSASARVACGLAGTPDAAVATLAPYPGYVPGLSVIGTVVVKDTGNGGIVVTGTLGGLEDSAIGGIHVHTGVSCDDADDVGGHYFPNMSFDPWAGLGSPTWSSDSTGASTVQFTIPSFSLTRLNPVANRAVVVHDSTGARIACGVLLSTVGEVVTLGPYPGNTANTDTAGTLVVTSVSTGTSIMGTVTHVEESCTNCGLHIHTGYTCDDASAVGGHYLDMAGSDPWASTSYTSDSDGVATVAVNSVAGFSMISAMPTAYRTVVLHNSDSSVRSGCGVIGGGDGYTAVATMTAYPGYDGALSGMMGTVAVTETEVGTIKLFGTLTGLESMATGGIHIHTGVTCDDASLVGGHYYPDMASDPWGSDTTYSTEENGVSTVLFSVDGFSMSMGNPVAGRVVVVHDSTGARVGCGVLAPTVGEVVTLGSYPGYTGSFAAKGTFVIEPVPQGLSIKGTVGGLEVEAAGGLHIHSGYTVAAAPGVGGHYYKDTDPWIQFTYPQTDAKGAVSLSMSIGEGFTMRASQPVAQRAFVLHASNGDRVGAGLISTAAAAATVNPTLPKPDQPGTCFRGDSTVRVRSRVLRAATEEPLTQVKVGDVVQTGASSWAEVTGLFHSKSSAPFVEITMDGPERHTLAATEHHTFPACGSKHAAGKVPKMLRAHELKVGDCLRTADGEHTVASAERKLATKEDETFTVELKGGQDLLLVGGVVTHAKPEIKAMANANAAGAKKAATAGATMMKYKKHVAAHTKQNKNKFRAE